MRKILPILVFIFCAIIVKAQTAFTPGNLVVYRYGDGTYYDLNGIPNVVKNYPVSQEELPTFLDEYTKAGVLVRTIALPKTTVGDQRALTGISTANQEGALLRSSNGAFLTVMGYEIAVGAVTVNEGPRVIGRISHSGIVNTATAMPHRTPGSSPVTTNIATARAAASNDGTGFWVVGTSALGVRYLDFEYNKGKAVADMTASVNVGGASSSFCTSVFNNKLYYSTTNVINNFSVNLPKTSGSTVVTNLPVGTTGINAFQFVMLDVNGDSEPDVIYATNEVSNTTGESKITKFVLENSVWTKKGDYYNAGINVHTKFLTVEIVDDKAVIYFTSIGTAAATTAPATVVPSGLYKIENTLSEDLDNSIPYTLIVSAPAKTSFRGVALAPIAPTTTPVKLGTFNGKKLNNGTVQLNWTTFSEKDNSHFEVLSSHNNSEQILLSTVQGNGNSDKIINYSFNDAVPFDGVNYYQLNQIDYNGKSEKSSVIAVNAGINSDLFIAYLKDKNTLIVQVDSEEKCNAKVSVTDISGKEIYSGNLQLEKGKNLKELILNQSSPGIGVITLVSDKISKTTKFIK